MEIPVALVGMSRRVDNLHLAPERFVDNSYSSVANPRPTRKEMSVGAIPYSRGAFVSVTLSATVKCS